MAVPAAIQEPVAAVRQGPPPVPGSRVVVRDEEWLVESVARTSDGWRLTCRGTSDLVRDTTATFVTSLDHVEAIDPAAARLVPDDSPAYRRTRLWLEAMLRKTPVPLHQEGLSVAHRMLLDPLAYQRRAVAQALSLDNLRPRILVADAVGLGKTLEIGMILVGEGVNLHRQCHHLVHVDLPWSLIRIEQRNGRIDRYGQDRPPRITAMVIRTTNRSFSADVRVLTRLLVKEHVAHKALGDAAGLMRLHDPKAEEEAVARALAEDRDIDTVVPDPRPVTAAGAADDWEFDELFVAVGEQAPPPPPVVDPLGLFPSDLDYLREAVAEVFEDPHREIGWRDLRDERLVQLTPPPDLRRRLAFLPHEYVAERKVRDRLVLATHPEVGAESLREAGRRGSRTQ
ncbi:MAG: hypothetical protein ACFCVG_06845 [Kineosporiaceae bacterium]